MIWTIDDIIDDCVRHRRSNTTESKVYLMTQRNMFVKCWEALNLWIAYRMRKKKGVGLPTFGMITWEFFKTIQGETRCRPVFIPTETFCKAFKIKYSPPVDVPSIAPTEDINYSRVAIRFSQSLTKDILFVGVRDIFRRIGETISNNGEVKIAFSVGDLRARKRKLDFDFDSQKISPPEAEDISVCLLSSRTCNTARSQKVPSNVSSIDSKEWIDKSNNQEEDRIRQESDSVPLSGRFTGVNPLTSRRISSENSFKPSPRTRFPESFCLSVNAYAKDEVFKQSYKRYLHRLKEDAELDAEMDTAISEICNNRNILEEQRKAEAARKRQAVRDFVIAQMRLREKEKVDEIAQRRESSETTIRMVPCTYTGVQTSKADLIDSLTQQIKSKADNRKMEKEHRLQEEKQFLDSLREQLTEESKMLKEKKEDQKRLLNAHWALESEFKKCKDILKDKGGSALIRYMEISGLDAAVLKSGTAPGTGLKPRSVGYDSRK